MTAQIGDLVTIRWQYNDKPESVDRETGYYRGRDKDGRDIITGPDGRTYVGTIVADPVIARSAP